MAVDYAVIATNAVSTIYQILIFAFVAVIAGLGSYMLARQLSFKHRFRIFDLTSGVSVVFDDRASIVNARGGIKKWKLKYKKVFAPAPPYWAKTVTSRGKFSVMAKFTEDGGFEYINPAELASQSSTEKFTVNQKIFLMNEFKKAELEAPKNWQDMVTAAVPYAALVIIVMSMFIFWGEITQPSLDMAQTNKAIAVEFRAIVADLKEIKLDKQMMKPESPPSSG